MHTHTHTLTTKKYKIGTHRNNLQVERYLMAGWGGGEFCKDERAAHKLKWRVKLGKWWKMGIFV